jgi:hypothetical protein
MTIKLFSMRGKLAIVLGLGFYAGGLNAAPPPPQGAASVNGDRFETVGGDIVSKAPRVAGLSIAGTYVANGEGQVPGAKAKSDYEISSGVAHKGKPVMQRVPNPQTTESQLLGTLLEAIRQLPSLKKPDDGLLTAIKKIAPTGKNPPFPSIAKVLNPTIVDDFIGAEANPLSNTAGTEYAQSEAMQTLKQFNAQSHTFTSTIKPSTKVGQGGINAVAFSINRDPMAVEWGGPAQITETLSFNDPTSPADLSLTASAAGGAGAAALYELDVLFQNFSSPASIPSDLDSLEANAQPLFQLVILVLNDGSGAPAKVFYSLEVNSAAIITDSMNKSGQSDVLSDIMAETQLVGDTLSFTDNYSFTVTVPNTPETSVLFTRDAGAGGASGQPLPLAIPALMFTDSDGDVATIDATGAFSCVIGSCTTALGPTVSPGIVSWGGNIGVYTIGIVVAQTKPEITFPGTNLNFLVTTGATGGSFTIQWTDTGFSGTGPITMAAADVLTGSVSAMHTGYIDSTDTPFGMGTLVGSIGPFTSTDSGTLTGPSPTPESFSLTSVVTAMMGPLSTFSLGSFDMMFSPAH